MKRFFILLLMLSTLLSAFELNIPTNKWTLNVPNDGNVHVVYLPVDIELNSLQSSLADGQELTIYNLAAYSSWMNEFVDPGFIMAIRMTNKKVEYLVKVDGDSVLTFDSFNNLIDYLKSQGFEEKNGFDLNDYLSYFKKLKAAGVYYIKSSGNNLKFNIIFKSSNSETTSNSGSTNTSSSSNSGSTNSSSSEESNNSTGLEMPPSVPDVNSSENSNASSNTILTPPSVPQL